MIPKYLLAEINRLQALEKGITINADQWTGLPITAEHIGQAITQLLFNADKMEKAQIALNKLQKKIHDIVNEQALIGDQSESLAKGIHIKEPEKLGDYGIVLSNRGNGSMQPLPDRAIIQSIKDDKSGEGFVLKTQRLPNATDFEIWRGQSANPDAQVLEPDTFNFLAVTKKLAFRDDTVQKGKRYFYRIRGFNRNGKGEWSSAVSRVQ